MYNGAIWITTHDGKMKNIPSFGTPRHCNSHCAENAKVKGSICEKCYAKRYLEMRKALREHLEENYKILTTRELKDNEIPHFNAAFVRCESFGDIDVELQAWNYIKIFNANPFVRFGWWSHNCYLMKNPIKRFGKPNNVQIVKSSLFVNKPCEFGYDFVDKTFTVYDDPFIKENGIDINCGSRSCFGCLNCYLPDGDKEVRERKKK